MNFWDFLLKKLHELLVLLENFGGCLVEKFNEAFPPENRFKYMSHWLKVGAPFALAMGLLIACLCCCCRGRCCRGRGRTRMMKAPGRDYMMPRYVFESNPKSYFRDLRGKEILLE